MSPDAKYKVGELVRIADGEVARLLDSELGIVKEIKYDERWKKFYYKVESSYKGVAQPVSVEEGCLAELR
jgi:hypothetical protein